MIPGTGIRVEIAFATDPDSANPDWVDVSSYALMSPGVAITKGRSPESVSVTPTVCSLVLKNDDGRFTPENTGSPYYPNVTLNRRLRVGHREPSTLGNYNVVADEDAAFEGGTTGTWNPNTFGQEAPSTLSNATDHVDTGSKALKITWPTTSAGATGASVAVSLAEGRVYTARVRLYVPSGQPDVKWGDLFGGTGALITMSTKDAFATISATFTATRSTYFFGVVPASATTSGQYCNVDSFMCDEGSSLGTFTTTDPPVNWRFTGFAHSWVTSWPSGAAVARAAITATDRLKRFGRRRKLRSIIEEEYLLDHPIGYWPLGEDENSTTAGDVSGSAKVTALGIVQVGSGGSITFGASTGPGTDGLTAPLLNPVNIDNGKILSGSCPTGFNTGIFWGNSSLTFEAFVNMVAYSSGRELVRLEDTAGNYARLDFDSAGNASFTLVSPDVVEQIASSTQIDDSQTHHVALTITSDVSGSSAELWVDGVSRGTSTTGYTWPSWAPRFTRIKIGGPDSMWGGTIAHVAVTPSKLTGTRILAHANAGLNGFTNERSDQRVGRYASYAGVLPAEMVLDVGLSTHMGHIDTTDQSVLDMIQRVELTETGVAFIDGAGILRFHSRSRRYNASSATLAAGSYVKANSVDVTLDDMTFVNDVTAKREGGITYRAYTADPLKLGVSATEVEIMSTLDDEVESIAQWILHIRGTPQLEAPSIAVDLLNDGIRPTALAFDISTLLHITGMPSQTASTMDAFIEGWTESITDQLWQLSMNLSPAAGWRVWKLNVAGASELGTTTRLAY